MVGDADEKIASRHGSIGQAALQLPADHGTIDWAYKREYGALGHQNVFNTGEENLNLGYIPGNFNANGDFYLTPSADVSQATLEIVSEEADYLSEVLEQAQEAQRRSDEETLRQR